MSKQKSLLEPAMDTGAAFSPCRTYRYALWRHWDWQGHANCLMVIGLNPSTADETLNDPTIKKCIKYAKSWGYGGLYMLNLFAYRSTKPEGMDAVSDPVGPGNAEALAYYSTRCGMILAAWGVDKRIGRRGSETCRELHRPVHCLKLTKDGSPWHPLYVKDDTKPMLFYSPNEY